MAFVENLQRGRVSLPLHCSIKSAGLSIAFPALSSMLHSSALILFAFRFITACNVFRLQTDLERSPIVIN